MIMVISKSYSFLSTSKNVSVKGFIGPALIMILEIFQIGYVL